MEIRISLSQRSIKQYRNIILSLILRGATLGSSFMIVPLSLSFLSPSSYGTWLVIYSIMGWTSFFDLGLGNGLKSRLSEALAVNNLHKARRLISTHYVLLSTIALGLITVFSIVSPHLNWAGILNVNAEEIYIGQLIHVSFVIFMVKLVVDSINAVLLAFQSVSFLNLIGFISGLVSWTSIFTLNYIDVPQPWRMPVLGVVMTAIPLIVAICFSFYLFGTRYRSLCPSLRFFHRPYCRRLFFLGGQFFLIQIAGLVIFSTDSMLVARLFDGRQVTIYNIAYKLFSCFSIVWAIIITPYWVAFNEAYIRGDHPWVKKTVKMLLGLWIAIVALLIAVLPFVDDLYAFWLGPEIKVPFTLSAGMALFVAISTFANIFAYFVNGVAKIRLQVLTSISAATINIPLAIYLSKSAGWGLAGIILATCISLSIGAVLIARQYLKIINGQATGIWNR